MHLGRLATRGLIPLSVFALLGSGLALQDPSTQVTATAEAVSGTPAVVRDTDVPVVDPVAQEAAPTPEAAPAEGASPDDEAAPEGESTPEAETEPGAPDLTEGHEDHAHEHQAIADAAVVAELEPRELEPFSMLGVTWTGGLDGDGTHVEARWRANGTWSAWTELHIEASDEGIPGTEPQWVGRADAAAVRVVSSTGAQPEGLELSTIDPGTTPDIAPAAFATAAAGGVPQPKIISRAAWGASRSSGCSSPIYGASTRGAVIHHTAGSNTYSASQSASIVKATQAYHTGARDWCDIGYNFLVDKYGQIFEGRAGGITRGVRAAHSGNGTVNQETVGVSMMGTFSSTAPTAAMQKAVADLVAWKFAIHGIPATGRYTSGGVTLDRIAGHRNVVGTECPGAAAYAWVVSSNGLRKAVAQRLAAAPDFDWPAPTSIRVQKSNTSWDVRWSAVPEVKTFMAEVSTSPSMSDPVRRSFDARSGTISGLKPSTMYYVRVAVTHSRTGERTSPFSSVVSGRTFDWAPPSSTSVSGTSSSSVAVKWPAVAGVKTYRVELSTSSTMSRPVVKTFGTNSGTFDSLKAGTTYYARVAVSHSRTGERTSAYGPTSSGKTAVGSASSNSTSVGTKSSIELRGHGYGHGIGMSQYGARGGASTGKGAGDILATYYPGTKIALRSRVIRVLISADNDGSTTIRSQSGLRFRQGSTDIALPTSVGGTPVSYWKIGPYAENPRQSTLRYKAGSSWQAYQNRVWTGPAEFAGATVSLQLPSGDVTKYRGRLVAAQPSSTSTERRTVNVVDLNDYVRGVVAREMPASWPTEALRSQAIAARTYGLRSISGSGYYDICDTTSCQVYGGFSAEDSRTNGAVDSTRDKVLMYGSAVALTQFSSSSGGFTNSGSQPYLKAVNDPWDGISGNPNHDWSASVSVDAIERRYPAIGSLQTLEVTKRNGHGDMGGRVTSLKLTGSKGSTTISGSVARFAFGLKSDWFGF